MVLVTVDLYRAWAAHRNYKRSSNGSGQKYWTTTKSKRTLRIVCTTCGFYNNLGTLSTQMMSVFFHNWEGWWWWWCKMKTMLWSSTCTRSAGWCKRIAKLTTGIVRSLHNTHWVQLIITRIRCLFICVLWAIGRSFHYFSVAKIIIAMSHSTEENAYRIQLCSIPKIIVNTYRPLWVFFLVWKNRVKLRLGAGLHA